MVQDAVLPAHDGSAPPIDTVAVIDWLPRPEMSTVILEAPWPLMIRPAVTDQV